MIISKRNGVINCESDIRFKNIEQIVRVMVNTYSGAFMKEAEWLTEREKLFFIATVIMWLDGITNPISDEGVRSYKKYFGEKTEKGIISDYINRVRNKRWIEYNIRKKEVSIPPIFSELKENIGMRFDISLSYGRASS